MLDATKTRDKNRLLCLHVRAYVAATYQLCSITVSNEKKRATKSDHVERKRERR
jgi:hypothetical protein